jgi:hypothetical protein
MANLTPIQLASLQTRVADRAARLFEDGYTVSQQDFETFFVANEEGTVYEVSTLWENCSCPFNKANGFCKHYIGLQTLIAKQEEARDAARCEEYEALYANAEDARYGCDPYARF